MKLNIYTTPNLPSNYDAACEVKECDLQIKPGLTDVDLLDRVIHETLESFVAHNSWAWQKISHEDFTWIATNLAAVLYNLGARVIVPSTPVTIELVTSSRASESD